MSVKRPYQKCPKFDFIRVLINPKGVTSRRSMPRCLIVCSSASTHEKLFEALLSIRVKEVITRSSIPHWSPMHELLNCISAAYQVMFQQLLDFINRRFSLLQDMVRKNVVVKACWCIDFWPEISRASPSSSKQIPIPSSPRRPNREESQALEHHNCGARDLERCEGLRCQTYFNPWCTLGYPNTTPTQGRIAFEQPSQGPRSSSDGASLHGMLIQKLKAVRSHSLSSPAQGTARPEFRYPLPRSDRTC